MSLVDLGKRLLEAAKRGDTEDVRTLMSNGAPFTTDWLGTSPLHFASQYGHAGTAEVLLRAGISRDARTKVDRTPLHVAAQEGHLEIVDLLLRNGADIEAKDMLKMTPLHWAVEKAHLAVIETLVKNGADIACENKFDKSPVEIAITNGRTDIAQILQMAQTTSVVEVTSDQVAEIVEEVTTTELSNLHDSSSPGQQIIITSGEPVTIVPHTHETDPEDQDVPTTISTLSGDGTDQSSTSVLATLAALAEATAPLNATSSSNPSASEALSWLEHHGITMISTADTDAPTIVTSQLETGQTLTLTEAGKLALNFVKQQGLDEEEGDEPDAVEAEEETTLEAVVPDETEQKVIAIVADQEELASGAEGGQVMVEVSQAAESSADDGDSGEPPLKKAAMEAVVVTSVTGEEEDQDLLRKQLQEVQKQAEAYKKQLRQKEEEAETYKKQLTQISAKSQ